MPTPTAEELLASVGGLSPDEAQRIADRIDECRELLTAGTDMDSVQQHLKDQGVPIICAILITTRPTPLRLVETSQVKGLNETTGPLSINDRRRKS
ncbi:hypothetical protein ACGFX8_36400, partial [Streptomyces sp. NPDC048362]|uniref:hypothetical protein n=1 Tax=Streptomyces sp. NPDC048362 TaxID=3365539 RepID=UPI0037153E0E